MSRTKCWTRRSVQSGLGRHAVAVLIGLAGVGVAAADWKDDLARGRAELEQGEFAKATASIEEAKRWAATPAERGDCEFYLGLTRHQEAKSPRGAANARQLLATAAEHYARAAELKPTQSRGASLNNLGQVKRDLGDPKGALAALRQAVEIPGPRQGSYAFNYAELLNTEERWTEAVTFYELASVRPGGEAAQHRLVETYVRHAPERLPEVLRRLAKAGAAVEAQEMAAWALEKRILTGEPAQHALGVIAYCLSLRRYDPEQFEAFPGPGGRGTLPGPGAGLLGLREDPDVGRGVLELFALHKGGVGEMSAQSFKWWRDKTREPASVTVGTAIPGAGDSSGSPAGSLRALARSLGDHYRALVDVAPRERVADAVRRASEYYRLAIDLSGDDPDVDALERAARLYLRKPEDEADAKRQQDQLKSLLDRYGDQAFGGKNRAYAEGRTDRVYRFHRMLGSVYTNLKKWDGGVMSAQFQLEAALRAADRWNEMHPDVKLLVDAGVVEDLATTYAQTKGPENAVDVRMTWAEKLFKMGDVEGPQRIIRPLNEATVPGRWKATFQKVNAGVPDPGAGGAMRILEHGSLKLAVTSGAASPLGVRLLTGGASGGVRFSPEELSELQRRVSTVVKTSGKAPSDGPSTFRLVEPEKSGSIAEVKVDGYKGSVVVDKGGKQVEVPFVVGEDLKSQMHLVRKAPDSK